MASSASMQRWRYCWRCHFCVNMPESEIIVVTANRATLEAAILTRRCWFVLSVRSERRFVARARVLSMRPRRRVGAVTAEIEA